MVKQTQVRLDLRRGTMTPFIDEEESKIYGAMF